MPNNDSIFNRIAEALLVDYTSVYYVNGVTNEYQWYSTDPKYHSLHIEPKGSDFFSDLYRDAQKVVYKDDQHIFTEDIQKENLINMLKKGELKNIEYRLMLDGKPVYHTLRLIRGFREDDEYFILGVINVDKDVRRRMAAEQAEYERTIYNQIASSLAEHFDTLYYINMDTDQYFEFSSTDVYKSLMIPTSGDDFFNESRKNLKRLAHPDDLDRVIHIFSKEVMLQNLAENNTFQSEYRLVVDGNVMNVRSSQIWAKDKKHAIVCIENINAEVSAKEAQKENQKKNITYAQIAESLAAQYDVIYYVNIENGEYSQFVTNPIYGNFEINDSGTDFFADCVTNAQPLVHPEDKERVLNSLEKDHMITALENKKSQVIDYRLMVDGKPQYTRHTIMRASDNIHCIIGVENINDEVMKEKEQIQALKLANELARRDELTGTKNKNAFRELECSIQSNIENGLGYLPFAIIVCDINDLKHINDTLGHKAGDDYIRSSSRLICSIFSHSPVFRIGGDEFVVFLRSQDYDNRNELLDTLRALVLSNLSEQNGPIIASGLAVYEPDSDSSFSEVFERADSMMYINKNTLKSKTNAVFSKA